MSQKNSALSDSQFQTLQKFRKELHTYPEVSGNEKETAKRVRQYLEKLEPNSIVHGIGGTGIIATYDSGNEGPTLLFRAELDALPIQEINSFSYKSIYEGVSHKCGHDGHTTNLLGLATLLQQKQFEKAQKIVSTFSIPPNQVHIACSAAALRYPKTQMDMVRLGILQYGFFPTNEVLIEYLTRKKVKKDPLRRLISWKSTVMDIKKVNKGDEVVLIGKQGDLEITISSFSEFSELLN